MPSSTDIKWAVDVATVVHTLALFMRGEIQLTEAQFDGHVDQILEFLEETNNHRYRFGWTRPSK